MIDGSSPSGPTNKPCFNGWELAVQLLQTMPHKRIWQIALFGSTAVLALTCALGAVTSYAFEEKVLPRTLVAGVDISNLSFPEAQQKITAKAAELSGLKLSFTLNDKNANATLGQLGVAVDAQSTLAQVIRPSNPFDWLSVKYWRAAFSKKELVFSYNADQAVVKKNVESILGITTAAKDAQITYENGQLAVRNAQKGVSISFDAINQLIQSALVSGIPEQATLAYTESSPTITTEAADATKTEISQRFMPIYLSFEGSIITVQPSAQFSFLDFAAEGGKITWQVSPDKIKSYLGSTVAARVNIKMLPKTTKSDTGELIQDGRDGRQMDSSKLADDIFRAIANQTDTTNSPIVINTKVVPFTEKIIYPNYVADLFPGLYAYVNLSTQQIFILNGSTLLATYLVSTGQAGLRTPPGQFYVCNKITLARSPLYKSLWMPLWNALSTSPSSCAGYVGYGVHGLPCFNGSCTLVESPLHLGRPVSHGCVRLPDDGARWFYDNMPVGTPVTIGSGTSG